MPRQRLRFGASGLTAWVERGLAAAVGLALVFYGAMLMLLALKVDPATVNSICGYRSAYDFLSSLGPGDVSSTARIVVGIVALVVGLCAAVLVYMGLPRTRLARRATPLTEDRRGVVAVGPRAFERAVEVAALEDPHVDGARARFDDGGLVLSLGAHGAERIPETLRDVDRRARESLELHGLHADRLEVRLVRLNRNNRRELA